MIFLSAGLAGARSNAAHREMFPGESADWVRYESPNFELYSANRDGESRELLHNLELLRALFLDTFKFKERHPLPVTIYYFDREKDFRAYVDERQRRNNLAGYYQSRPDRAVIVLSPTWDDESARHVIFHEYIHHLVRTWGEEPPPWYDEGLAEVFSSVEVYGDKLDLGKPLPWHVETLRTNPLLPLETLFSVDRRSPIYNNGKHSGLFYAESWALLHYLYYGRTDLPREKIEIFMYQMLLGGGADRSGLPPTAISGNDRDELCPDAAGTRPLRALRQLRLASRQGPGDSLRKDLSRAQNEPRGGPRAPGGT